jgi:hypothetical protein
MTDERVPHADPPAGHEYHTLQSFGLVRCQCGDVGDATWLGVHLKMRKTLVNAGDVLDVSSVHRRSRRT